MLFKNIKIKTGATVLLAGLFLSALLIAILGLYFHAQSLAALQQLAGGSVNASALKTHLQQAEGLYQVSMYWAIGFGVLTVILAILMYQYLSVRVVRPLHQVMQHFESMAAGDLSQRVVVKTDNEMGSMFSALRRLQDALIRMVSAVRNGMDEISAGSIDIADGNRNLSDRTSDQAAALQQTAASMGQLAGTVRQNADNAHQANQLAATASDVAQRGGKAVGEVVATMQGISASSSKIADIVGVIDSIAFQTNILALNAAVEAARAGEQGRGFAVVASEVRALAQRSAQAAREITALIDDSVSKVSEGSGQVERAGATMQEIVDSVKRVTDIMGEITAATIEQSSGIDQINRAVGQMDEATQYNSRLVEQTARAATTLNAELKHVQDAVTSFRLPESEVIDIAARQVRAKQARKVQSNTEHRSAAATGTAGKQLTSARAASSAAAAHNGATSGLPKKSSSAAANDMTLLRPDLSGTKKAQNSDDDWVEF
ncbi:methyl-accepting chemotaxis protein [Paenalcaligenes sp. Me131]|uniref:methyl-accepting chemotaxis protein n=1 Tax=Paenalcaligenes sp. Me131 TaxID=3392636 RepID=UPI003D2B3161